MKISWAMSPCDVLWYYEFIDQEKLTDMRCIWTKHEVGANGESTKACFIRVGTHIDKIGYIQCLEGLRETNNAYHYLFRVPKHHQVKLAKVTKDEGDSTFVDEITLEKSADEYAKKTPRNVVMNTTDPLFTLPNVGRTTPYLDYGAGLLFPRIKDVTKAPNQVLLEVEDRVEEAVLGPFVMGDGTQEFQDNIPVKEPDDFRFSLPNGVTVYIKSDKTIIIQQAVAPTDIPTGSGTYIKIDPSGNIDIDGSGTINIGTSATMLKLAGGGNFLALDTHDHQVPVGPAIPGPPANAVPTGGITTKTKAT